MIRTDMVPPENFKWFYERPYNNTTEGNGTAILTSVSRELPNGEVITDYFHQGRTWASWSEDNKSEEQLHIVDATFPYGFVGTKEDPFESFADILKFSTGNSEVDAILNDFLKNLIIYPDRGLNRYMPDSGRLNLQV
ncbi:MAG: hypothetical protein IJC39_02885 [Firmicutes bacterium]|nr:hypothetical protein [Bacillota bacterium]